MQPSGSHRVQPRVETRVAAALPLLRYGTVSLVSTLFSHAVILSGGYLLSWSPQVANLVGTVTGSVLAFLMLREWVWRDHEGLAPLTQAAGFAVLMVLGLAASSAAVTALSSISTEPFVASVGNVLGFAGVWVARVLLLDGLLFGSPPPPGHGRAVWSWEGEEPGRRPGSNPMG